MGLVRWIVSLAILVVLIGAYVWMFLYTRKRQKAFDEQYKAMKERHEVFVLNKKIVRERGNTRFSRYAKFKTYHVVGRVTLSQSVKGMQMSKMQTVTFHTTKQEFEKIQGNRKYKMDIAGNYIGYVVAPPKQKAVKKGDDKSSAAQKRSFFRRKPNKSDGVNKKAK